MGMNYAVIRPPSESVALGLRMRNLGEVNSACAKKQHQAYCGALEALGFSLLSLPPMDEFPDSTFVEDPAIVVGNILVAARLREKSRQGEERILREALEPFFSKIIEIESPGFVEGGDVLVTDRVLYIGLSGRTNIEGAEQLAKVARDKAGIGSSIFKIPEHYLHLKGGVSYHRDTDTVMVSEEIESYFSESPHRVIAVPHEERFGANAISRGRDILIHNGRSRTKKKLEDAGFRPKELNVSEFEKIDGALTCLSKIFHI